MPEDNKAQPSLEDQEFSALAEAAANADAGKEFKLPEIAIPPDARESDKPGEPQKPVASQEKPDPSKPETPPAKQEDKPAPSKEDVRKENTWKAINAEKEKLKAEREEVERLRREAQEHRPDDGERAAKEWEVIAKEYEDEGRADLADAARRKAHDSRLESRNRSAQAQQAQFAKQWQDCYADQCDKNPDLTDPSSALYKGVEALLKSEPVLASVPNGVEKAVNFVKQSVEAGRVPGLLKQIEDHKKTIEDLNKKLAVGASDPGDPAKGPKSFDDMSDAEQEKFLRSMAEKAERELG